MLTFESFASSSAGCAYRVSGGGAKAPLLLDAGIPFARLQAASGFGLSKLAGVLVSHAHGDHCQAVPKLLGSGIDVYASPDTWKEMAPRLGGYAHRNAKSIEPETPITIGDWTVIAFPAIHDCPGTLGFLIGSPQGDRLLYLTDSMYSPFKFEGLTHIAVECNHSVDLLRKNKELGLIDSKRFSRVLSTHMSIERLLDMLAANDLSRVEAIHLLHLSDTNSNAEDFKRQIMRATGKPTYVEAA